MRRFVGQAALGARAACHRVAAVLIPLLVIALVGTGALAWRLTEGPIQSAWLARQIQAALNPENQPLQLHLGSAAIAWEGFRQGGASPLDIRVTSIAVIDRSGATVVNLPRAEISLSLPALLLGRLRPWSVTLDDPHLALVRTAEGAINLISGPIESNSSASLSASELLEDIARPYQNQINAQPSSLLAQLRRVRVHNATVSIRDEQLHATWQGAPVEINLFRRRQGAVHGTVEGSVALADQAVRFTLDATVSPGAEKTVLHGRLSPISPAGLARAVPALARLGAVDAPIASEAEAEFGARLSFERARLQFQAGSGIAKIGGTPVEINQASLAIEGTLQSASLRNLTVAVRGHPGGPVSTVTATGMLTRTPDQFHAAARLDLDAVAFADLPHLWPAEAASAARAWVTENITGGSARNAHLEIGLEAPQNLSQLHLASVSGTVEADQLTVHWLRPVPPIEHGQARLNIIDPDRMEIAVLGGRQRQEGTASTGGLQIRNGTVRLTGLMQKQQTSAIDANITGSLPDAITLLRNPRLHLLSLQKVEFQDLMGAISTKLSIGLPLNEDVTI
ncbi:MAG: hypothetical protein JOY71_24045, partial [Acetobacteraceae bacterium]|nr:hypothetical protein [Acetobacteraceae bacterium]